MKQFRDCNRGAESHATPWYDSAQGYQSIWFFISIIYLFQCLYFPLVTCVMLIKCCNPYTGILAITLALFLRLALGIADETLTYNCLIR
jgi:hypothetical protein